MATAVQDLGRSSKKLSHGDRVDSVVSRESLLSEPKEIADSWRRCQVDYRVDAKSRSTPHVVTQGELKASQEPVANMLVQAQDEMDRLYAVVRQQAYVVLLCNSDGIAVHHRGEEARAEEFKHWGIWLGGVWSEQAEGTNGIGTCITDQRPVLVHCGQHFRSRHTQLSCAGAPIFDPHGQLAAVLDVSRVDREGDNRPFPLVLATTMVSARAIEERMFRTLMDLRLPAKSGIDAMIAIRSEFPEARIIMLTTFEGDVEIQHALEAGARGYLLKSMPPRELVEVIRQVYAGKKRIPLQVAARLAEHISDEALTDRETEVLGQIAGGSRNRDIAEKLFITEGTVKAHIKHIMHKLGARDRTQAVAIGLRRGIIQL